eukprot:CAMPEP_0182883440 /NCGR_PEP_ID=MMETSP0034_2-20130328/18381_1 /TAXON_ID=156128 /ORGANISM="Nephroselmis pyriformis, Strain CCMP717" /LENGTH=192 /DNA_ID=CAMNT_0025016583 /DNA_START=60 /DNA_END=635 /DNA_ORIENTATION=+
MSTQKEVSSKAEPVADAAAAASTSAPVPEDPPAEEEEKAPAPKVKEEKTFERDAESLDGDIPTEEKDGLRLCLKVASGTHIGFGPLKKENQDDLFVAADGFSGEEGTSLFCVFDGHGTEGKTCAVMVQKKLPEKLAEVFTNLRDTPNGTAEEDFGAEAISKSFVDTNTQLVESKIDCSISGTTVSVALLRQR